MPSKPTFYDDGNCSTGSNLRLASLLNQERDGLQNGCTFNCDSTLKATGQKVGFGREIVSRSHVQSRVSVNDAKTTNCKELAAKCMAKNAEADVGERSQVIHAFLPTKANRFSWINRTLLIGCFVMILLVSAVDTWFTSINDNILNVEKNPFCTWLLQMDAESCSFFVAGKILGTILVLSTLLGLLRLEYRYAWLVIIAVTLFQVGLISYLCLSDPKLDGWINFLALFDDAETSIFSGRFITSD